MPKHGEWNHIEIPADDPERARRFYEAVAGWEFRSMEGYDNYWLYTSGPGELGGGLGIRGESAPPTVRAYLYVDGIDRALEAVTANGGSIHEAKTDLGFGWYASVSDSEGNEIGLYERKLEA